MNYKLKWKLVGRWNHRLALLLQKIKVKRAGFNRFPDDYSRAELVSLIDHHHDAYIEVSTKYSETLQKLIEARKELSKLKRNK